MNYDIHDIYIYLYLIIYIIIFLIEYVCLICIFRRETAHICFFFLKAFYSDNRL